MKKQEVAIITCYTPDDLNLVQCPMSGSQSPVTLAKGDLTTSSGFCDT